VTDAEQARLKREEIEKVEAEFLRYSNPGYITSIATIYELRKIKAVIENLLAVVLKPEVPEAPQAKGTEEKKVKKNLRK
jgi:hypothetical protein